jgi:ferrous-iron efflux pump FieF
MGLGKKPPIPALPVQRDSEMTRLRSFPAAGPMPGARRSWVLVSGISTPENVPDSAAADGADRLDIAKRTHRLNLSAGLASVATALLLVALKLWAVHATGSLSIAASLTDSALDLVASTAGLIGILYATKPPDEDHSFGHSSVEDLVALGQAVLVAIAAGAIGWSAIGRFSRPHLLTAERTGLMVLAISMVITLVLVLWQGRVAARTGSRIVVADRLHYLSDLLPAAGAMVALVGSVRFGLHWLDPVIALVACAILVLGARRIGLGAWDALMDRQADPELIARIEATIAARPGVLGFHDLKTRTAGSRVFVQVHLELDGSQTLLEAHSIGAGVRHAILAVVPDGEVIVHKDPV